MGNIEPIKGKPGGKGNVEERYTWSFMLRWRWRSTHVSTFLRHQWWEYGDP